VHYRNLVTSTEPQNLANALAVPNWKSAMESEFSSLLCNKTWHLVPPISSRNLIDCKWVYKIKHKADGSIDRYKLDWWPKVLGSAMVLIMMTHSFQWLNSLLFTLFFLLRVFRVGHLDNWMCRTRFSMAF
jgi:hypothetical protein